MPKARTAELDWRGIADRFFSFHAGEPQADLVKRYESAQAQISRWKAYKENIPLRVLAELVAAEGVSWDWLLTGEGPKRRRPAAKAPAESNPEAASVGPSLRPQRPRRSR